MGRHSECIPLSKFMVRFLAKLRDGRSETTVFNILNSLTSLRDRVPFTANNPPMPERFNDLKWLTDIPDIETRIAARAKSPNSRYTFIKNILTALGVDGSPEFAETIKTWRKKLVELKISIDSEIDKHEADESMMTWDKIIAHRDAMEDKSSLEFLLVCLYTMIPPLRNDFVEMDIVFDAAHMTRNDWNYYCVPTRTIHLNAFKTSKISGAKQFVVPTELHDVIQRVRLDNHRRTLENQHGIPMLVAKRGGRLAHSQVVPILTAVFGCPMGSSALRKSFVSQYGETLLQIQSNADAMCHSVPTAAKYYVKL